MTPTLLFLLGTVAVACNGAVIKGRPCEHQRDEEIQAEPVLVNIPEAPMLPPFSSNALEFVAPLQDEIKPETPEVTASLPTVPLSYQPASIVSGDYAWPTASIYPNYPVNVLSGQAALDYPGAPAQPAFEPGMAALQSPAYYQQPYGYYPIAQKPCKHGSDSFAAATPVLLPYYVPALAPETESKPVFTSLPLANDETPAKEDKKEDAVLMFIPEAPILPPFVAPEMPKEEITPAPMSIESLHDAEVAPCEKKNELVSIPEAPVLPAFVAPEIYLNAPTTEEPKREYDELPVVNEVQPTYEYVPIPEAPVLSAFVAPEFPTITEPKLPAKEENCDEPATQSEPILVIIPEAPVLPPFSAPAALPIAASEYYEPKPEIAAPCEETKEETYENFAPIVIPTAPELPPFVAPEIPIMEDEKEALPAPTEAPVLCEEPEREPQQFIPIPAAPVLPTFVAPEMPAEPMYEEPKYEEPQQFIPIPEAPVLPTFVAPEMPAEPMYDEPKCEEPQEYLPIPEAPLLPTFVAPEMPTVPMYDEPKCEEPQEYISIPEAPVLPTFVAPEMPTVPMYDEPKSEDCDKDKEYKPVPVLPYYLPIPASYALSSQSGPALPESTESIAECIRKILANRVSPSFYANLIPAAQGVRAPMVPLSSPFYYKPAMSNDLPVY